MCWCLSLQNQTGSLAGFLPLLMGSGAFSGLGREVSMCPGAGNILPRPAEFKVQKPICAVLGS